MNEELCRKFRLKQDYVIPAGTEFSTNQNMLFTSEVENFWAKSSVDISQEGSLVLDIALINSRPDLFERIEL